MHNSIVFLAALTLGIALIANQASAIPTTDQWLDHLRRVSPTSRDHDFRAEVGKIQFEADRGESPSLYHRGR